MIPWSLVSADMEQPITLNSQTTWALLEGILGPMKYYWEPPENHHQNQQHHLSNIPQIIPSL